MTVALASSKDWRISKNTVEARRVGKSPGAASYSRPRAWIMPSLISSRHTAGQPRACAKAWAKVVLPEPAGPLTTTSVGIPTSDSVTPRGPRQATRHFGAVGKPACYSIKAKT